MYSTTWLLKLRDLVVVVEYVVCGSRGRSQCLIRSGWLLDQNTYSLKGLASRASISPFTILQELVNDDI